MKALGHYGYPGVHILLPLNPFVPIVFNTLDIFS